jgi:NADPH2:quinone reductase
MRAIVVDEPGDPEAMKLVELPTPEPGPGEVLIEIEASGLNFIDLYTRSGAYPSRSRPIRLGLEGAGRISAIGPGGDPALLARRVAWSGVGGSYATHLVAPADKVVDVPQGIDPESAAAAMLQGLTAHYLSHDTYRLGPGDRAVVHAAAGGVGRLLCQYAREAGAEAIGVVSSEDKVSVARNAGAAEVIVSTRQSFDDEVRRMTRGEGVAVVYDSVGRETFERSLGCLRRRGLLVLYGQSSGAVAPIDPQLLNAKGSLYLTRPTLDHHVATKAELTARSAALFEDIRRGVISLAIHRIYPLAQAASAHRELASRRSTGKILLRPLP